MAPRTRGTAAFEYAEGLVSAMSRSFDREAEFERQVLPHRSALMRAIWRLLRDADLAEEALQEALLILWRKLPALERHPNPLALILRIGLDAACDVLRAHMRERERKGLLGGVHQPPPISPQERLERDAVAEEVLRAISRLRSRQAAAILLRVVHGLPYEAIARALRCGETTARVHVLRGRAKLRRWLSHLRPPRREKGSS